jgi:predicted ATP-dependent endonuclease of OLD family
MSLTKIEIHGYRGFRQCGTLNFAVPSGEFGSGLTVLTGPNNSGKSCILECLRARSGQQSVSFTAGTRNADIDSVEIKYSINGKEEILRSITHGSSETTKVGIDQNFHIFVLPSRRAFNPYFGRSEWSREQYINNSDLPAQRSSVLSNFEYRLFNIVKSPEAFNELLSEALGYGPQWTIDRADQGQYFLKFFNGKHSHSSDGMGEGVISIFAIVDALYDSKPGDVVVIDEPELSLHPSLQKRVALLLSRFSKDRQIIISTHSPYFVNLFALANGGHLARITTTVEGTKINQLTPASKDSICKLSDGNLYNPHVFGLDSRELFFQEEKIILTEGQEDVLLYPKVAEQLGLSISGNFFGWGAGGASNIMHLCLILKDLGFVKVAGLLDGDKNAEAEALKEKFPEFFFACIPAKDIRTKPARKATEYVDGLLDSKLVLQAEFTVPLNQLFSSLANHMNT